MGGGGEEEEEEEEGVKSLTFPKFQNMRVC